MPHELVPNAVSTDVVDALEVLLAGARAGHITGIAYAAVLKKQRYIVNLGGTCLRNLTHARGMVMSLNDEIGLMLHDRDPRETR